jgi:hypothetical protein
MKPSSGCLVLALAALAALAPLSAADAQTLGGATSGASSVAVTVSLPGGFAADLAVSFESVTGLSLANLGLAARVIDPHDPALLARLPVGTSIPAGFPVLLRTEPPAAGGLAFHGIAAIDLHTENLQYAYGCPLRLFAAPLDGPFADITDGMGAGSYRVRGTRGGFSEFLLVADLRPLDQVIAAKLDRLQQTLDANSGSLPAGLYSELAGRLAATRSDVGRGDAEDAIHDLDLFLSTVVQHSGTGIPDLWRASRDVVDVAGLLRAGGRTLRFSLALQEDLGP